MSLVVLLTWPRITAEPIWPGVGKSWYQPAGDPGSPEGVWTSPFACFPTGATAASTPMEGTSTRTGTEAGSGASGAAGVAAADGTGCTGATGGGSVEDAGQEQGGCRGRDDASAAAAVPGSHQVPACSRCPLGLGGHLAAECVRTAGCEDQATAGSEEAKVRSGRSRGGDAGAGGSGGHGLQGAAQCRGGGGEGQGGHQVAGSLLRCLGQGGRIQAVDHDDGGSGLERISSLGVQGESPVVGIGGAHACDLQVRSGCGAGVPAGGEGGADAAVGRCAFGGADDTVFVGVGGHVRAHPLGTDVDVLHVRVRVSVEHGSESGDFLRDGCLVTVDGDHDGSGGIAAVDRGEVRLVHGGVVRGKGRAGGEREGAQGKNRGNQESG